MRGVRGRRIETELQRGAAIENEPDRVVKPLDPRMIVDAGHHPLVVTIEDGIRDGGAGTAIADAVSTVALDDGRIGPPVRVLGTPVAYIPQGKADDILRDLGLDGPGVAGEVRRLLAAIVHS